MFQTKVNYEPARGVPGTRASLNPMANYVTGPGGLISNAAGVAIARFAWAIEQADGSEVVYSNAALVPAGASRVPSGFVQNEQQGLNTVFLSEAGMSILGGQNMGLQTRGDFWVTVGNAAVKRQKAFASLLTGEVRAAAEGAVIAAFTGTASFAGTVMTVTAVTSGTVKVGQRVVGAGVPDNTYVASLGTGAGGAGTYNLTQNTGTIAAQATVTTDHIETRFRILSSGDANEVVKIGYGD